MEETCRHIIVNSGDLAVPVRQSDQTKSVTEFLNYGEIIPASVNLPVGFLPWGYAKCTCWSLHKLHTNPGHYQNKPKTPKKQELRKRVH